MTLSAPVREPHTHRGHWRSVERVHRMSAISRKLLRMQAVLLKPRCVLCDGPGLAAAVLDLCAGCYRDLPRLTDACAVCARPAVGDGVICGACQKTPPPFERVIAPYRYAWPIDKMIQQFKFGGNLAMGRVLGRLLAHHLTGIRRLTSMPGAALTTPPIVVPVPLHRRRLWQRGFNQATELARTIGLIHPLAIRSGLCGRVRDTPAQSAMRAAERHKNVQKAFALRSKTVPERIVIIDDVMTTGSTCAELARTFKSQGTRQVLVWCLARA